MNTQEIKIAVERIINSLWYLKYIEISGNQIKILEYDRNNEEITKNENKYPTCELTENNRTERIVTRVIITERQTSEQRINNEPLKQKAFAVVNQKHIFSWPSKE